MKDIDKINGAIDNPTKMDKSFTSLYDVAEFDVAGLTEKGSHRNYNHDLLGGLTKALAIDPVNGFEIYTAHVLADSMSNIMRQTMGTSNRDIAEVLFKDFLKAMNNQQQQRVMSPHQTFIQGKLHPKRMRNKTFRQKKSGGINPY